MSQLAFQWFLRGPFLLDRLWLDVNDLLYRSWVCLSAQLTVPVGHHQQYHLFLISVVALIVPFRHLFLVHKVNLEI